MGAGDCGSADDQSRWIGTLGDLDYLDIGELQTFNQPTNQPTGHSVSRTQLQTQHTLANRSGIFHLLPTESGFGGQDRLPGGETGRRKERYIIVVRPDQLLQIHPSLPPVASGFFSSSAFRSGGCPPPLALRRFTPFPFWGIGRQKKGSGVLGV